jgi:hypothetical protein
VLAQTVLQTIAFDRLATSSQPFPRRNCAYGILVERPGFEPGRNEPTSGLQPGALPSRRPLQNWSPLSDSNGRSPAYKAVALDLWAKGANIISAVSTRDPPRFRRSALVAAHRRLRPWCTCSSFEILGSERCLCAGTPEMTPWAAKPKGWSRRWGSNPRPQGWQLCALPTALRLHGAIGGLPPSSGSESRQFVKEHAPYRGWRLVSPMAAARLPV